MESFMLECHEKDPRNLPGKRALARLNVSVYIEQTLADSGLEGHD